MSRPSLLTPERADNIITMIENGMTRERAAAAAGISERTLYAWRSRGEMEEMWADIDPRDYTKPQLLEIAENRNIALSDRNATKKAIAAEINDYQSPYVQFLHRLRASDARAMAYGLQEAHRTGREDWRFWAFFLERRFPNEWGRREPEPELSEAEVGTEKEAETMLERAETIRIKMLEAGP